MVFTDFVPNLYTQFIMGFSYLGCFVLLIFVNMVNSVFVIISQAKKDSRKKKIGALALFKLGKYKLDDVPFSQRFKDKLQKKELWSNRFQKDESSESIDLDLDNQDYSG